MSIFDPHSLFIQQKRATKKGQILQKKPIPTLRAYTNKDLQDAYRVLKAYGIPYGNPPPPPPEPEKKWRIDNADISYAISEVWKSPYVDQSLKLLDIDIIGSYLDSTDFGQWLTTEVDPEKVISYLCAVNSKNIVYFYDPATDPRPGQPYEYQMQVQTLDNMSTFSELINFDDTETADPDHPNRYISKSMVNWTTDNSPHYVLEYNNVTGGQGLHYRYAQAKDFTDAYNIIKTNEELSFNDFKNLNFVPTQIAETHPSGSWQYDTEVYISTIANITIYVEYTE